MTEGSITPTKIPFQDGDNSKSTKKLTEESPFRTFMAIQEATTGGSHSVSPPQSMSPTRRKGDDSKPPSPKGKPLFFVRNMNSSNNLKVRDDEEKKEKENDDNTNLRKGFSRGKSVKVIPPITKVPSMEEILLENELSTNPEYARVNSQSPPGSPKGNKSKKTLQRGLTSKFPTLTLDLDIKLNDLKEGGSLAESNAESENSKAQAAGNSITPQDSGRNNHATANITSSHSQSTFSLASVFNIAPTSLLGNNLIELAFPPANILPFLPSMIEQRNERYFPDHLDVIICVEHCCDCHLHNDQSLRHNVQKYVQTANAVLFSLITALINAKLAIRLYAMRAKPLNQNRIGAFEVTIAMRTNLPELVTDVPILTQPPTNKTREKEAPRKDFDLFGSGNTSNEGTFALPPSSGRQTMFKAPMSAFISTPAPTTIKEVEPMVSFQRQKGHSKWITHRLFSKLETKR